jgi:hypothetical protein
MLNQTNEIFYNTLYAHACIRVTDRIISNGLIAIDRTSAHYSSHAVQEQHKDVIIFTFNLD